MFSIYFVTEVNVVFIRPLGGKLHRVLFRRESIRVPHAPLPSKIANPFSNQIWNHVDLPKKWNTQEDV